MAKDQRKPTTTTMRTQTIIFKSNRNLDKLIQYNGKQISQISWMIFAWLLFVIQVFKLRQILNSYVLPISITFEIQILGSARKKGNQQWFKVKLISSHILGNKHFFVSLAPVWDKIIGQQGPKIKRRIFSWCVEMFSPRVSSV